MKEFAERSFDDKDTHIISKNGIFQSRAIYMTMKRIPASNQAGGFRAYSTIQNIMTASLIKEAENVFEKGKN